MLNNKIIFLRSKLDNMLLDEVDYDTIYSVSIELDNLIVEYYKNAEMADR